jgi:hypothetical protein
MKYTATYCYSVTNAAKRKANNATQRVEGVSQGMMFDNAQECDEIKAGKVKIVGEIHALSNILNRCWFE